MLMLEMNTNSIRQNIMTTFRGITLVLFIMAAVSRSGRKSTFSGPDSFCLEKFLFLQDKDESVCFCSHLLLLGS